MEKFDEYTDVLHRLVAETVRCTPASWTRGALTIYCDGARIDYKLKNDQQPGAAVISESLRTLIDELYVRMARRGEAWTQAVVTFDRDGDKVNFDTSFRRQPPPTSTSPSDETRHQPTDQTKPRKSWLKFWQ